MQIGGYFILDGGPMFPVFQDDFDANAFTYSSDDMKLHVFMNTLKAYDHVAM